MQRDELVTIANEMCKKLLEVITDEKEATKVQVANYLMESAQVIMSIDKKDLSSEKYAQTLFHNAYKEIAQESILSYTKTNENIKKLVDNQDETLKKYSGKNKLISEIDNIQVDMNDEVKKASIVIEKLNSQIKSLEKKSNIDPLTNLYNRRALNEYVDKICSKKSIPDGYHFFMLDADDFKMINDTHGHLVGDKVLVFLSSIFKKMLRDEDRVFRYGGEEFIIVLNRINDENCLVLGNRILDVIRDNKLIYKDDIIKVTLSIGATNIVKGDNLETIIARADKALYAAKNSGKDKMVVEIDGI